MATAILNFNDDDFVACNQGSEFSASLTWNDGAGNPIDLSPYTALMQVRKDAYEKLIVELSTTNGYITMSSEGVITFDIPFSVTSCLPAGSFLYDFKLYDTNGIPSTILRGEFVVKAAITLY